MERLWYHLKQTECNNKWPITPSFNQTNAHPNKIDRPTLKDQVDRANVNLPLHTTHSR